MIYSILFTGISYKALSPKAKTPESSKMRFRVYKVERGGA
jgi:hypothetical protein